jgi:hypothetical protein
MNIISRAMGIRSLVEVRLSYWCLIDFIRTNYQIILSYLISGVILMWITFYFLINIFLLILLSFYGYQHT